MRLDPRHRRTWVIRGVAGLEHLSRSATTPLCGCRQCGNIFEHLAISRAQPEGQGCVLAATGADRPAAADLGNKIFFNLRASSGIRSGAPSPHWAVSPGHLEANAAPTRWCWDTFGFVKGACVMTRRSRLATGVRREASWHRHERRSLRCSILPDATGNIRAEDLPARCRAVLSLQKSVLPYRGLPCQHSVRPPR